MVDGIIVNCDSCGMRSASMYAVSFQSTWLTCIERRLDSRAPVHVSHAFAYDVTSCIFRFETRCRTICERRLQHCHGERGILHAKLGVVLSCNLKWVAIFVAAERVTLNFASR